MEINNLIINLFLAICLWFVFIFYIALMVVLSYDILYLIFRNHQPFFQNHHKKH